MVMDPALAAALVAAQTAVTTLHRNSSGDKGAYTSSDDIAAQARKALNEAGLSWMRTGVTLEPGTMSQAEIGNQSYAGDVVTTWVLVHSGGGVMQGSSRMAVITSRGRPHDKAVAASLTYLSGQTLRGILCWDRESKDAVDKRKEQEANERDQEPLCVGKLAPVADACASRCEDFALLVGADKYDVWSEVCRKCNVEPFEDGSWPAPHQLTKSEGLRVKDALKRWVEARTPQQDPAGAP